LSKTKQEYPKTWKDYQNVYDNLESRESNRLTFSTFLGGLTFAAFAAFESSPIKVSLATLDVQSGLALVAAILLGVSTLIFLAVAASAYQAIRHLSHVSQESKAKLQTVSPGDENIPESFMIDRYEGDKKIGRDLDRIRSAWSIHEESEKAISLGFLVLILALIFVGLEVNYSVGIVVIIALLAIAYYFRTVRNMLGDWIRAKVSRS
jgi:hypothetical protein